MPSLSHQGSPQQLSGLRQMDWGSPDFPQIHLRILISEIPKLKKLDTLLTPHASHISLCRIEYPGWLHVDT